MVRPVVAVGAIVLAATFAVERGLFGTPASLAVKSLGLGKPYRTGVTTACAVSALLWLVLAAFVLGTGVAWTMALGWLALVPGLFAQAGIAEETLFRGYLFRHLRQGRSFMRAALLSMLPFVAVHLILFLTMPWPIALAAVLLSVVLSFPFARLFELGGNTIWGPAVLHFVVQGDDKGRRLLRRLGSVGTLRMDGRERAVAPAGPAGPRAERAQQPGDAA